MTPIHLKPSPRLRSKYRLLAWLILVSQLFWSLPLAFFIGFDVNASAGAFIGLGIALLLNALWFLPTRWLVDRYYDSIAYEIQEDEVIVHVGIWTHSVKHVPFRTVTNIAINRDIFDRFLFAIGTVEIQTAGAASAQASAEESLAGLTDYEGIYNIVAERLRRYRGLPMSPTQAVPDAPEGVSVAALSHALLEEVRMIRMLLERDTPTDRANESE
ncbi:MAG: PH domain-containing protein [Ardenticatenaceae bacterium]